MTISAIREVIQYAQWENLDLQGHTREEFARRNVPAVMKTHLEALDALVIAPRFARDVERRAQVRANCERRITAWLAMQPVTATLTKVASGTWLRAHQGRELPAVVFDRGDAQRPAAYREYDSAAAALVEFPNLLDISVKMRGTNRAGSVAIRYEI